MFDKGDEEGFVEKIFELLGEWGPWVALLSPWAAIVGVMWLFQNQFNRRFDDFKDVLKAEIGRIGEKFVHVEERLTQKITHVEDKIVQVEEKLTQKITHVEDKIVQVEEKLTQKITHVEDQLVPIRQALTNHVTDTNKKIEKLNDKIEKVQIDLGNKVERVQNDVSEIKGAMELSSFTKNQTKSNKPQQPAVACALSVETMCSISPPYSQRKGGVGAARRRGCGYRSCYEVWCIKNGSCKEEPFFRNLEGKR